ncbi:MAG: DUF192 domain-containing protein [Lentisphaerae bacterium]|nr:MAG: DUF192 domain-containing protein [Lentisphaerota bacterium]
MITRADNEEIIARHVICARSHGARMRGMLGRRFDQFDAMYFPNNASIHTFFMRIPLLVIFLDREYRVRRVIPSLPPWRLAWCPGAFAVVEMGVDAELASRLRLGDELRVEPEETW